MAGSTSGAQRRKAGATIGRATPVRGRAAGATAERARVEAALRASEARFRAIFDCAAIGIALTTPEGELLEANRALQAMVGYSGDELRRLGYLPVTHPDDRARQAALQHDLMTGARGRYQLEKRYIRKDGRVIWVRVLVSAIAGQDGAPRQVVALIEDITRTKRLAAQLAEAREAKRRRLARELHDGAVQQLLAVSYRLAEAQRQAAEGGSGVSPDSTLAAARREVLQVAAQLRGLIGELRPADLADGGLAAALERYAATLRRAGGPAIAVALPPDAATLPRPGALCLFRVTQEALRNACRHAGATRIGVRLRRRREAVVLRVRDDGHGFPAPARLHHFAQTGHYGLVGLAERVAQAGGELTIRSRPGAGTIVTVRLPLGQIEGDDGGADPGAAGR
ncbi:MAG TPA: PAS domain S-box protein [Thermomicrobiales bacterium]|nr:PAS domain S-box protein [Thermomicrobiales bacterium]